MKLREIATFEIEHQLRLKSTWFFAVLMLVIPLLMIAAAADSPRAVNAPFNVLGMMAVLGMLGMAMSAAIFGEAATRDVTTGTHPLFYTVPISKLDYVGGRFLGAFAVNALLLLLVPLSFMLAMVVPFEDDPTFLPFALRAYLEPFLSFMLPNLFFSGAILFGAALLTRSVLSGYLSAVGLFMAYLIGANEAGRSLDTSNVAAILDPFGLIMLRVLTVYMPPSEQETAYVGFPALLVVNRLVWLGIGVLALLLVYRRFRFDLPRRRRWFGHPERSEGSAVELQTPRYARGDRPAVERSFGPATRVRQVTAIAWRSLSDILTSRTFQVVVAAAIAILFLFGWDVGQMMFDTSTYHITHLVSTIMRGPVALPMVVLIGLYAGELVWKEREMRISELTDTEPMPTWVVMVGKLIALLGMIAVLQGVFMLAGMLLQAVRGYYRFEPWVYVQVLFMYLFAIYALFAATAFAIHTFVNSKYVGHFSVLLLYMALAFATEYGLDHGLLVFNSDPGFVYSDMNGFGPFAAGFFWFKAYWAAWALLLCVVASLFWLRGTESGFKRRLSIARSRFRGGALGAATVAVVLIAALGGFVFYNTNVINTYKTGEERTAEAVAYEKRFGRYADAPQPRIVGLTTRIEIHPEQRAVDLRGTYRLVNKTSSRIDSVHVMVASLVEARSMRFDRAATLVLDEKTPQTYRIYALGRPLMPGDSLQLTFDHHVQARGFQENGAITSIAANGAYFDRRWMPMIGYQTSYEVDGEGERLRRGLPQRPATPPGTDARARQWRSDTRDADLVDLDVTIGTAPDQIAVTTGELVREWTENGKRYFHYRTDAPVQFSMPFLSARYAMREGKWKDIPLKVLYHPTHDFNIDRLIKSMQASLEYYTTNFGPYQFKELRIAEFPRYANFARGHPQTISFSEGSSFLSRIEEGDIDRTFFVAAHEIAHQWWGNQVASARVEGAAMVSETLAMYSSMMVMEKTYGPGMVKEFYDWNQRLYLRGRSQGADREMPLLRVRDQNHVYYHKGATAMWRLKERIGEERINTALRSFLKKWKGAGPPYPTSLDLYGELLAVTPDSVKPMMQDLFETITLWDLSVGSANAERVGPNEYRVSIDVEARKVRAAPNDSNPPKIRKSGGDLTVAYDPPKEVETPMDEWVEIGVYEWPEGKPSELIYLQPHRIRSGKQTITVTVTKKPWRVGVDPRLWLIQRNTDFKVVELQLERPRPGADTSAWRARFVKPKRGALQVDWEGL